MNLADHFTNQMNLIEQISAVVTAFTLVVASIMLFVRVGRWWGSTDRRLEIIEGTLVDIKETEANVHQRIEDKIDRLSDHFINPEHRN